MLQKAFWHQPLGIQSQVIEKHYATKKRTPIKGVRQLVKKLSISPRFCYNKGNGAFLWISGEKTHGKSQSSSI